jgi:putative oxygen-independent coproporphyrinogen III oxidase
VAGIYIHIPFCKKACHYCNFHFSTLLNHRSDMVDALVKELILQKDYIPDTNIETVYLGGGTPSVLEIADIERIFSTINTHYRLKSDAEITLEANPDDLTSEKIQQLKTHTPVNRFSIGIQSFSETDLAWMNRAHNSAQAHQCIESALDYGFDNLSIDLIYGVPTTSDEQWAQNLQLATEYGIAHLSCYCLTVEEGTALHHSVAKGKQAAMDEEKALRQFEYLMDTALASGYEHYEISNFAKPDRYARHNSNYWHGVPYLGIGPSAHAFNGHSRQWNIANNALYMQSLALGTVPFEIEHLNVAQRYNEYIMTALRTQWGVTETQLATMGTDFEDYFKAEVVDFIEKGLIVHSDQAWRITRAGKFLADGIASDLFWVGD